MTIAHAPTLEHRRFYTYQDYLKLPEDGMRYEIIDGELFMSPAPTLGHQRILGNFYVIIFNFLEKKRLGEVFFAPTDVIFSEINILQPDLVFVSHERFEILTRENIQGAPDLVIEVLSLGTQKRDRTEKLRQYERFGVQEYWMVNHEKQWVEVWRREGGKLIFHKRLERNQILTTPLLHGLKIRLTKIFRQHLN